MNELLLFLSTFFLVFCLGLQSNLVRDSKYFLAAVNSLAIGTANLVLFKLAPDANPMETSAYLIGGPVGIVCSMLLYDKFKEK